MNRIKIVFLGTPDFAVKPLLSLINNDKVEVLAVVCNKDKPVGRKQILTPPPTKVIAEEKGIPCFQYDKIRLEGVNDLRNLRPDLLITCAFGQILSQDILDIPKIGVFNIHGSLLPKYRGASPVQSSILNGEKETGITIMKTDIGIDTGDIIYQEKIEIRENETAGELFERLSVLGEKCINIVIDKLQNGSVTYEKQNENNASLTKIIKKSERLIDFNNSALDIVNKIRAFNPSPIAFFTLFGEQVKVYRAEQVDFLQDEYEAGQVVCSDKNLIIATKNGFISILELQKSGGKRLPVKEFLLGNKIPVGTILNK